MHATECFIVLSEILLTFIVGYYYFVDVITVEIIVGYYLLMLLQLKCMKQVLCYFLFVPQSAQFVKCPSMTAWRTLVDATCWIPAGGDTFTGS